MACEVCRPETLDLTDEAPNPCQDAEEQERSRICDDCGADLTNVQMWEGKLTGRKLCDACFERWRQAGRARESGVSR